MSIFFPIIVQPYLLCYTWMKQDSDTYTDVCAPFSLSICFVFSPAFKWCKLGNLHRIALHFCHSLTVRHIFYLCPLLPCSHLFFVLSYVVHLVEAKPGKSVTFFNTSSYDCVYQVLPVYRTLFVSVWHWMEYKFTRLMVWPFGAILYIE